MTRRRLLARLDAAKVEAAIRAAESGSAIEIRVSVAGLFWGNPQRVAEAAFRRLGMSATGGRTGVLVFLVPWLRRVIILPDQGITAKVDASLWTGLVDALTREFKQGRYTEGVVTVVQGLGAALAPHFPPLPDDRNELPNAIDRRG